LDAFAELRKATIIFFMSVRMSICPSFHPHGTSCLSLNVFYCNLIFAIFFSKICRDNSIFIKRWKEQWALYTKTNIHLWTRIYLSVLLIMRDISDKFVEKIKTYILLSITFFFEIRARFKIFWENLCSRTGHRGQCGAYA